MNNRQSRHTIRQTQQASNEHPKSLRILQINLNKLEKAHLELLNNLKGEKWDVVLVQEPHATAFCAICTPTKF